MFGSERLAQNAQASSCRCVTSELMITASFLLPVSLETANITGIWEKWLPLPVC